MESQAQFPIVEAATQTVIVYHGSPYSDIERFRIDNLRHRTGTEGTLSFTTNIETAKIYGDYIYKVEVSGHFGDYQNAHDVEAVFDWRMARAKQDGYLLKALKTDQDWERLEDNYRYDIVAGFYAMWENKSLWRAMGWDGAWCFESEGRNLIVGSADHIRVLGKMEHARG